MPLPLLAALLLSQTATAPSPAPDDAFGQVVTAPDGRLLGQTACRKLTAPGKPDVWLVGAVHVGRPEYYKALQALLDEQKLVLCEGVAEDEPEPKCQDDMYGAFSKALGLQTQEEGIDYDRPNWQDCDLSMADLERLDKESGKGKASKFQDLKSVLDPKSKQGKEIVGVLQKATPGVLEALRLMLVRSVGGDGPMADASLDEIVLHARNRHVLEAFDSVVMGQNPPASIALFYGIDHMAELQKGLTQKYGYVLGERRWLTESEADPRRLDADGEKLIVLFDKALKPKKKG